MFESLQGLFDMFSPSGYSNRTEGMNANAGTAIQRYANMPVPVNAPPAIQPQMPRPTGAPDMPQATFNQPAPINSEAGYQRAAMEQVNSNPELQAGFSTVGESVKAIQADPNSSPAEKYDMLRQKINQLGQSPDGNQSWYDTPQMKAMMLNFGLNLLSGQDWNKSLASGFQAFAQTKAQNQQKQDRATLAGAMFDEAKQTGQLNAKTAGALTDYINTGNVKSLDMIGEDAPTKRANDMISDITKHGATKDIDQQYWTEQNRITNQQAQDQARLTSSLAEGRAIRADERALSNAVTLGDIGEERAIRKEQRAAAEKAKETESGELKIDPKMQANARSLAANLAAFQNNPSYDERRGSSSKTAFGAASKRFEGTRDAVFAGIAKGRSGGAEPNDSAIDNLKSVYAPGLFETGSEGKARAFEVEALNQIVAGTPMSSAKSSAIMRKAQDMNFTLKNGGKTIVFSDGTKTDLY